MARLINFYDTKYWKSNLSSKGKLRIREIESIKLLKKILKDDVKILDAGCGDGNFLLNLKKKNSGINVTGVDFSREAVLIAKKRGISAVQGDLNGKIPFKNSEFDVVYSGEVIEHLYNPDFFLKEIRRILKNKGYLLITTPNLGFWFNRLIFLLGIQPTFMESSTEDPLVGSRFLKKFRKLDNPIGHIRVLTYDALKDLLEANGFSIVISKGVVFEDGFPKWLLPFDKILTFNPRLSAQLVILAKKEKD